MGAELKQPWHDADRLQAAYAAHGSIEAAAASLGCAGRTFSTWWRKHKLPRLQPGPPQTQIPVSDHAVGADEFQQRVFDLATKRGKKYKAVNALADELDVSPKRIREVLPELRKRGLRIDEGSGGSVVLQHKLPPSAHVFKASPELFDGDQIRFGQISDTHYNSMEDMVEQVHTAYEIFREEGIKVVYHTGDLVAGRGIYRHQDGELKNHSFRAQVQYAVDHHPEVDGITTYLIGGNHDLEGEFGRLGADPCQAFCHERKDVVYCGQYEATFELPNGGSIQQLHPIGGRPYAISYRGQKLVEGIEGGQKPSALVIGHLHARAAFRTRNIEVLYAGCFEGQTSLGKRIPGDPATGFHIVTATLADDGSLVRWLPEWFAFYRGRLVSHEKKTEKTKAKKIKTVSH